MKNKLKMFLAYGLVLVLSLGMTSVSFGITAGPTLIYESHDPSIPGLSKLKADPPNGGTISSGNFSVIYSVQNKSVSWELPEDSLYLVYAVYVKGGTTDNGAKGNLYEYPNGSDGGSGLTTPAIQNVSHVTFYYKLKPVPTPTPEPTETPTPAPTETPTPAPTETPTPAPTETPTPAPTETPTPEPTETPTPAPEETPTPAPTETPTPAPTETPTPAPEETPTPAPEETPTPAPEETPTPAPEETPTPEPTETPAPQPTETPAPEPTETPAPQPTETPAPQPTETPAPQPTETPAPTSTPNNNNNNDNGPTIFIDLTEQEVPQSALLGFDPIFAVPEEIVDEEISEGAPVLEPEPEVFEILDVPTPQGVPDTLPQTSGLPSMVFYASGAVLAGLGSFFRRR